MLYRSITREGWDKALEQLLLSHTIFASIENESGIDYELISKGDIERISYNKPKPATSLKSFFLPVKENVTSGSDARKPAIILGVPNCDIEGLRLLDEIYLNNEFTDPFYKSRRENTILISSDCITVQEHCHCMSYNIHPFSSENADIAVFYHEGKMILRIITSKGEDLVKTISAGLMQAESVSLSALENAHRNTETLLSGLNHGLPGYKETADLVARAGPEKWKKYSSRCVSCGACVAICPTCSCFLLIDKPGFEKIKQLDGCQYPGFERVAGGADPLVERHDRFRNRYLCKYEWKAKKFTSPVCTGCGRCIEACIGKINKNEIFVELSEHGQDEQ